MVIGDPGGQDNVVWHVVMGLLFVLVNATTLDQLMEEKIVWEIAVKSNHVMKDIVQV